jgi:cytochrome P450
VDHVPELVKAVLLDERDKFRKLAQVRLLGPLLGQGILTSEGADWKWQRQASAPMFRPADLAGYVPAFVGRPRARSSDGARRRPASTCRHRRGDDARHLRRRLRDAAARLGRAPRGLDPALARDLPGHGRLGAHVRGAQRAALVAETVGSSGGSAVADLRGAVAGAARNTARGGDRARSTLMQRLIAARDPETGRAMDDEQLVDNLLTFYLAGHETTAKALTWTLYLIARSPHGPRRCGGGRARDGGAPVAHEHVERLVWPRKS